MRYKKKPVEIDAFQMTSGRRQDNCDWPEWLHIAWQKDCREKGALTAINYPNSDGTDMLQIQTLEGAQVVAWDDFIIRGIKGEIYPCKPDIFSLTYDRVED